MNKQQLEALKAKVLSRLINENLDFNKHIELYESLSYINCLINYNINPIPKDIEMLKNSINL